MKHALRANITTYKVVIIHSLYELNIFYRALLHADYTSQEDMAYILLKSMRCDWVETLPDIIQSLPQLTMFATALHWFLLLVGWDSKKEGTLLAFVPHHVVWPQTTIPLLCQSPTIDHSLTDAFKDFMQGLWDALQKSNLYPGPEINV